MTSIPKVILKRRSIRRYQQQPVPEKTVECLLKAACWAPSAHNAQPWRFIILSNPQVKKALAEAMAHAWVQDTVLDDACKKPNAEAVKASIEKFTNAPVLVLMCISLEDMHTFNDERRRRAEHDLALQSLGAAVQNLLLTAQTLGLGACWHCAPAFCQETVRKVLQIPENIEPQALITVGFPAETPEAPMRKPLREIAYVNHWGNKL